MQHVGQGGEFIVQAIAVHCDRGLNQHQILGCTLRDPVGHFAIDATVQNRIDLISQISQPLLELLGRRFDDLFAQVIGFFAMQLDDVA